MNGDDAWASTVVQRDDFQLTDARDLSPSFSFSLRSPDAFQNYRCETTIQLIFFATWMNFVTFEDTKRNMREREREKIGKDWKRKEQLDVTTPDGYELIYIYIVYIYRRKKKGRRYSEEREEESQWPEVPSTRLPNIVAEDGLLVLSTVDLYGESSNLGRGWNEVSGMPGGVERD